MKFCQFVASLNPHISANFSQSILIFNKMALIFLGVLSFLPFEVSSFSKSDCHEFIANDEWPQFTKPRSTGISGLRQCWSLITSCNRS